MHSDNTSFLPLCVITILAFIVPILTTMISEKINLQIPTIVGEIVCGIIIGKSGLGLINNTTTIPWLNFLYLFGFTYLMFLSGLEVNINAIFNGKLDEEEKKALRFSPLILGNLYFFITLILAYIVADFLEGTGFISSRTLMALMLATTSVGIVVPVLKDKNIIKNAFGQTILLSALIADFLTVFMVTIFLAFKSSAKPAFNVLIVFALIATFIVIYRMHILKILDTIVQKFKFISPIWDGLSHSTSQIKVRGAIALMVLLIVTAEALGFEVILGAFLAGVIFSLVLGKQQSDMLDMKLDAIGYGFFIPIFFISVGINLNLSVFFKFSNSLLLLIFLVVSAFAIKIIPAVLFKLNFPLKESLNAGILLASNLSLIIAISTICLRKGYITEQTNATIIMAAVVLCTIAPILFNKLYKDAK